MSALLEKQVVVVVGGAGLLGRAVSSAIAEHGGTVIVADQNEGAAESVAAAIRGRGGRAHGVAVNICDSESLDSLISTTVAIDGRIDGVVNTAYPRGANYGRSVESVTYRDFCENVDLHLGGYFLVLQRFAIALRERGAGGALVSFGSIYGTSAPRFGLYEGTPMTMPVEYAAIKAGIVNLTRYFAQYYKKDGIRVNAVSPGGIFDGQPTEFRRRYDAMAGAKGMLDPVDVTAAVVFLLGEGGRSVTGQNLIVDDGWSL